MRRLIVVLLVLGGLGFAAQATAQESEPAAPAAESFHSDLFTGAATFRLPVPLPPGISGMAPALVLTSRQLAKLPAQSIPNLIPRYWGCLTLEWDSANSSYYCTWGYRNDPDPWGQSTLFGYVKATAEFATVSLYRGCLSQEYDYQGGGYWCTRWGYRSDADPWGLSQFIGYGKSVPDAGTVPLYSGGSPSTIVGYIYPSTTAPASPYLQEFGGTAAPWIAVGWGLETGHIARLTKFGTPSYTGSDTFVLSIGGVTYELVPIGSGEYRTKIESFLKITFDGTSWTVFDKSGRRQSYGSSQASRTGPSPSAASGTFLWALDRVEDRSGNFIAYTYTADQGQLYPGRIDYAGNSATGLSYRQSVLFWLESRPDPITAAAAGFTQTTASRLKTIEVQSGGQRVRALKLSYSQSPHSNRSLLASVTTYGSDATLDSSGNITGGSALPSISMSYQSSGESADLLTSLQNGLGGSTTLSYTPSTSWPNTTLETGMVIYTVSALTASDGRGWSATRSYSYSTGYWSTTNKEFRGFGQATATDPAGTKTTTAFHQDDVKKGQVSWVRVEDSAGRLFAQTQHSYTDASTYPGVSWARLDRTDSYQADGGASSRQTAVSFTYDAYGNLTRSYSWGDVAVTGDERDDVTEWQVDQANWLHRPSRTALSDAAGSVLRERWMSYDSRGLLAREESRLAGGQGAGGNPAFTHTYDSYGHRISTTDPRGCTTSAAYESSQLFPATATTCLGHTTTFAYDSRWGVMTSQTDPNAQTTSYSYDAHGRLTRITGPLDTGSTYGSVSYSYLDWGSPSAQRIVTYQTEQHGTGNARWSEQFLDGLGRVYLSRSEGPGGQTIQSETTYDARGLMASQSAPHFSTDSAVLTQFSYDALGRQTRVTHPDGTYATTSYAPGQVTLTDERGNAKLRSLDAYGRLTRVDEAIGSVTTYQYDGAGLLTRVTNHLGHVTTTSYDGLGRKTAMADPNMGSWTYSYDLSGNLLSQTDAKGQTLTFTYDLQGRLLTKSYPTLAQIVWTYDDTGVAYSKGRLTKVQDLTTETSFTYDPLGRVTQTRRLLDGVTYSMTQSYDALSRVTGQTFPDNETVSYAYNEAGWLSSIPGYVSSVSYNARGQQTALTSANGVTTTWSHDPLTFRVTRQQAGPGKVNSTLPLVALTRSSKSWTTTETILEEPPPGYAFLYRGRIGVVNGGGGSVGGEVSADSWAGSAIGYMKTSAESGTVPVYRTTCYSDTGGSCSAWGMSLTTNGTIVGYLATSAPDATSATMPFVQSGGLLLQGVSGTASAYLWTAPTRTETVPHTDHYYFTSGSAPSGYTGEGTTGYLHQNADSGTAALKRYVNSSTGHHYYSTAADYPIGFTEEAVLGYIHTSAGTGLVALYRHYNSTTKDYLLDTSATPPSGYTLQATVGYVHTGSTGEPTTTTVTSLQDLAYSYDAKGNITAITDSVWTGSRTFGYDALNRLVSASGAFGPTQTYVTQTYRYDAIGNLLEKAGVTYAYSDPSHPSAVTSTSDGRVYTYDLNGNMLNGAGRAQSWDADNRLSATTIEGGNSATYGYDFTGTRIKKTTSAGVMLYPFGSYEIGSDGVATKFLQIGIEKVAAKKSTGEKLFYHNDHLGGVNLITDSQGVKVQLVEYDPWGQVSREEGSADPTHRFTGEELDPETGLLYYGGRHYDPILARFISPDPFVPRPWDPQSLNRYTYVRNNPVNRVDPTGYEDGGSDGLGEFGGYENSGADYSADSTSDFGSKSSLETSGALFGRPVDVYLEITYTPSPPSPDNPPTTPTPTPAPEGPTNFASPSAPNHGSPGGSDPGGSSVPIRQAGFFPSKAAIDALIELARRSGANATVTAAGSLIGRLGPGYFTSITATASGALNVNVGFGIGTGTGVSVAVGTKIGNTGPVSVDATVVGGNQTVGGFGSVSVGTQGGSLSTGGGWGLGRGASVTISIDATDIGRSLGLWK